MMRTSDDIGHISAALVAVHGKLENVAKDSTNPHFKNHYASLGAILEAVRPVLAAHDLAVVQGLGSLESNALLISTRLLHKSGQWIETTTAVPLGKLDAQSVGSAATYGRRYALAGILSLAQVDDDGEEAAAPTRAPQRTKPQAKAAPAASPGTMTIAAFAKEQGMNFATLKAWIADSLGDQNLRNLPALGDLLPDQVAAIVAAIKAASEAEGGHDDDDE